MSSNSVHIITFTIGYENYATYISTVREIIRVPEITTIPRTANFVSGLINLRGVVVTVIDLRKRFEIIPATQPMEEDLSRIMVIDVGGLLMGVIVDSVLEVVRVASESVEENPLVVASLDASLIDAVCTVQDRLTLLLDLTKILQPEELRKLQKVA